MEAVSSLSVSGDEEIPPLLPPSSSSFTTLFSRFLRAEVAVRGIWCEMLKDNEEKFPRHLYTLCSLTPQTRELGFFSIAPIPFSLEGSFPLETYFSFFLHTIGHSYLHSSVGTFAKWVDMNHLPFSPSSLFDSPELLPQLLVKLVDIIMFSSVEILEELSPVYSSVFSHVKASAEHQRVFLFKTFFLNFICSCLEQPQVILCESFSSWTLALCSYLAKVLAKLVSLQHQQLSPQQQQQQQQQLEASLFLSFLSPQLIDHLQKQLEKLSNLILWREGGREGEETEEFLMSGYSEIFLPFWEKYHSPCQRKGLRRGEREGGGGRGGKYTCSMKEPHPMESFLFLGDFLCRKKEKIMKVIEEECPMGRWSLQGEALEELEKWMNMEEVREGLDLEVGEGCDSPQMNARFLGLRAVPVPVGLSLPVPSSSSSSPSPFSLSSSSSPSLSSLSSSSSSSSF